ncbi:MAG: hypothetical protein RSD27_09595 [Ruthenibacterium sp.]
MSSPKIQTPQTMKVTINGCTVEMTWRPDFGTDYTGRFHRAQCFVDSEVLRRCSPLVPLRDGYLQKSGTLMTRIGSGNVRYGGPYGARLYRHPEYNFSKAKNAQAGGEWIERMKRAGGREQILRGAQELMR